MRTKGKYKCKECKGTGKIQKKFTFMYEEEHLEGKRNIQCPKCKGDKWVDWIEQIVGKEMSNNEKEQKELEDIIKSGNWTITGGKLK